MSKRVEALREKFLALVDAGVTPANAAQRLSLSSDQFLYLRRSSEAIRMKLARTAIDHAQATRGIVVGGLRERLDHENYDFGRWLAESTPDGGTIVDTLIAIARDAFHEEMSTTTSERVTDDTNWSQQCNGR